MKLYYDKRSKDPIYYVQQGFRNGKKTTTKNVAIIGKHSELLKITDDPLSYAKEQIQKYNDELKNNKVSMEVVIDFDEKIKSSDDLVSSVNQLNVGYFFLQKLYNDLKISDFIKNAFSDSETLFDPDLVNRFLTYESLLDHKSTSGTYSRLQRYYEQPTIECDQILLTMDLLARNYDEYIVHLYKYGNSIAPRDSSFYTFDYSSYHLDPSVVYEDYTDEVTGEKRPRVWTECVKRELKPKPAAKIGLLTDSHGIPISMCIDVNSEHFCAVPIEKKITQVMAGKNLILYSDENPPSSIVQKFNAMGGKIFIMTRSLKSLSEKLKSIILNDHEYRLLSDDAPVKIDFMKRFDKTNKDNLGLYNDFAYKIIESDQALDFGLYREKTYNKSKTKRAEYKSVSKHKMIILFSRKLMEYQRYVKKHLSGVYKYKAPHELPNNSSVDEDRYDGFYCIATNTDYDVKSVMEFCSKRQETKDSFMFMKRFFSCPIQYGNKARIVAHTMVSYASFLIKRLLEYKLNQYGTTFSSEHIVETLRNMEVLNVQDMYYQSIYGGSQICMALNAVFDLGLDKKYYRPRDLNKKIRKILP